MRSPTSNRREFKSLSEVVSSADELDRPPIVHICRCPYCAELLILPARPYAVTLPITFIESDEP